MATEYVIHSTDEDGYWSNLDGWVGDIESATTFDYRDLGTMTLPLPDGQWQQRQQRTNQWGVTVQIESTVDGWNSSIGLPWFIVDGDVQGCLDEAAVISVVERIVRPRDGEVAHITAVRL